MSVRSRSLGVLLACGTLAALLPPATAEEDYYPPRDWSIESEGKMNISGFLFRDMNRNGIYDLPDRPMEDIAVEMTGPRGEHRIQRTNSNGFANFSMSKHNDKAYITEPGDYAFDVIVPEGWSVTTGNKLQVKSFRFLPGAVGDMIADPPFVAVGLVQDLRVFGKLPQASAGTALTLESASAQREVELQADGSFSAALEQGDWTLRLRDGASGATVTRSFPVGDNPVQVSRLLFGDLEPLPAPPRLVDFEDVTDKSIREMPNGVGGLSWWNFVALEVAIAYTNNAMSGHYVAYNSSGHPARIYHDEPFDFVGGNFGVAWSRANGETLQLRGWRGEELVYEDSITLSYLGPIWFAADYRGITRLDLQTEHYWQFVSDDLVFRVAPPAAE